MNTDGIKVVAKKTRQGSELGLKVGELVVSADFAELVPCEFPIGSFQPIAVEIPESGARSAIVGAFSGVNTSAGARVYSDIIRVPAFTRESTSNEDALLRLETEAGDPAAARSNGLSKTPVFAIATRVSGEIDGAKVIQFVNVLPVWSDGTSVLVTLDWFDGEQAEGSSNPEWHIRASSGVPLAVGLQRLNKASKVLSAATRGSYHIFAMPSVLAATALGNEGRPYPSQLWKREWRYEDFEEYGDAVLRLVKALGGENL